MFSQDSFICKQQKSNWRKHLASGAVEFRGSNNPSHVSPRPHSGCLFLIFTSTPHLSGGKNGPQATLDLHPNPALQVSFPLFLQKFHRAVSLAYLVNHAHPQSNHLDSPLALELEAVVLPD